MESSHHYLDQSSPMKFNIGDFVYTKRIGGEWTKSEIILHRDDPSNEHEYFVHYEGFNRRLDEWVHEARIISIDDYLASNQSIVDYSDDDNLRKMTRKQKRRFDEMNHSLADLDPVTAALERDYAEVHPYSFSADKDQVYHETCPGDARDRHLVLLSIS
ncbi:Histone acetyltransferase KAT8 [Thelohanellus kitauei]|uniref:Histone acetyltransferase KAT8 n=1 Tax=Thelohanellus kitauei TaxID=669202 RepID=A0A0C2IA02_THEKT|nr:Histone acetyltransferase KAT8 [Thelohanellus kitauei]